MSARRGAVRDPGPRKLSDPPRRHRGAEARWLPVAGPRRDRARLRADRARRRLRRGRHSTTRAELRGDHWVLTGAKRFISNAPVASLYVVFARTGTAPGAKGVSAFVVPGDAPGLTGRADAHARASRHRGARLRRLPHPRGPPARAPRARAGAWPWARSMSSARRWARRPSGSGRPRLDLALAHARRRTQFGQPIAQFQAIQREAGRHGDRAPRGPAPRLLGGAPPGLGRRRG